MRSRDGEPGWPAALSEESLAIKFVANGVSDSQPAMEPPQPGRRGCTVVLQNVPHKAVCAYETGVGDKPDVVRPPNPCGVMACALDGPECCLPSAWPLHA